MSTGNGPPWVWLPAARLIAVLVWTPLFASTSSAVGYKESLAVALAVNSTRTTTRSDASGLAAAGLDSAAAPRDIQCCVVSSAAGTFEDNCEVVTTDTECDALGGFTYPLTGACNPNPCPFPAFACCVSSSPGGPKDSCRLVTTSERCDEQGGTSLVDVTACAPSPCVSTTTTSTSTTS